MPDKEPPKPQASSRVRGRALDAREIDSRELLAGARTLTIVHGGEHYQLRLTQSDRLILTK